MNVQVSQPNHIKYQEIREFLASQGITENTVLIQSFHEIQQQHLTMIGAARTKATAEDTKKDTKEHDTVIWTDIEFEYAPPTFANTSDDLASNYNTVLLHWFMAALKSYFTTRKQPYEWFLPTHNLDTTSADFPARFNAYSGEYIKREQLISFDNNNVLSSDAVSSNITIGILSDWAASTRESFYVAQAAFKQHNDYNVHLGDTYFTGTVTECAQNFCGVNTKYQDGSVQYGIQFPYGTKGALALPGNHEAYSHCIGFRNVIMPFCGTKASKKQQQAPFWSLETEKWIVIGLDTAYNSVDGLQWNPKNNSEFGNLKMKLPEALSRWLRSNFGAMSHGHDSRGIILLSHHQSLDIFDDEPVFEGIADELAEIFHGKTIVWLWGHEHRLVIYKLQKWISKSDPSKFFSFYGICCGFSGFPCVDREADKAKFIAAATQHQDIVYLIEHGVGLDARYGRNGFCRLTLLQNTAQIDYFVINSKNANRPDVIQNEHILQQRFHLIANDPHRNIHCDPVKFMQNGSPNPDEFTVFKDVQKKQNNDSDMSLLHNAYQRENTTIDSNNTCCIPGQCIIV